MLEQKDSEASYKAMTLRVRIMIRLIVWQMELLNKLLKPLKLSPTFAIYDYSHEEIEMDEEEITSEMKH